MINSIPHIIKKLLNDRNKTLTVKERIVVVVNSLRSEGYQDDVIRYAIRESFTDGIVTRQFVNRVLVAPTSQGGCGMSKERMHLPSKAKTKTHIKFDPNDVNGLFSALLAHFDGKPLKVIAFADKLHDLAVKKSTETKSESW